MFGLPRHLPRVGLPTAWVQAMREKLQKNAHKGTRKNWTADPSRALLKRVREETTELQTAIRCGLTPAEVRAEAADIANMAHMAADAYEREYREKIRAGDKKFRAQKGVA